MPRCSVPPVCLLVCSAGVIALLCIAFAAPAPTQTPPTSFPPPPLSSFLTSRRVPPRPPRMRNCSAIRHCGAAGYCDPSIGHCLCLPGWRGRHCETPYLAACRMSASGNAISAPCSGFAKGAPMSCQCRRDCAALHAVHGFSKHPFSSADTALCWTAGGHEAISSGLPHWANASSSSAMGSASSNTVSFWVWHRRRTRVPKRKGEPHFQVTRRTTRVNGTSQIQLWGKMVAEHDKMAQLYPQPPLFYVPSAHCPASCSYRGVCVENNHGAMRGRSPVVRYCACHAGFFGPACEQSQLSACLHSCSGHGVCADRMCVCDAGWWGLDCSLSDAPRSAVPRRAATFAPTYLLPLPTEWAMQHVYQGTPRQRGMYEASRLFLERLHSRGHLVARPEEAALFFVPVLFTQMHGCLWEPQSYLDALLDYLRSTPPFDYFWNRHGGADHVFFTTQDLGGCYFSPAAMARTIVVSHFGFTGGLADFMSQLRWRKVLEGTLNASDDLTTHRPGTWRRLLLSLAGEARAPRRRSVYAARSADLRRKYVPRDAHLDALAATWLRSPDHNRWVGPCYDRAKDVIAPTDFVMVPHEASSPPAHKHPRAQRAVSMTGASAEQLELTRRAALEATRADCTGAAAEREATGRTTLLFMSGARKDIAPWYSQGVRQTLWSLLTSSAHSNASRSGSWDKVVFKTGDWSISMLRQAQFCLCPSGWGFGWRASLALATLCIPVIIQPLIEQAYHDLLPYKRFALFYNLADLPRLPQLLESISPRRICELRAAAARYYRALMWEEPDGRAYDMLQLSLCQRAAALHARIHAEAHDGRPLPTWASCANTSAEDLL
ncbi:hypothetical protein AB1Y20_003073 [Prymnesium parvum]|uniref:EGF-like domain-containing protein n=1 Tax=Prymnesium parvum TaxID=97485 RepID=A0AB34JBH2_PRYPA